MNRILFNAINWIFEKIENLCVFAGSDEYRAKMEANGYGAEEV